MELNKGVSIHKLKKADYNPGEMLPSGYLKLKESLKSFGFLEPIVYHIPTGIIVDGHHRYDALMEEGTEKLNELVLGDIGWMFPEKEIKVKDENQLKAMNIALRKIRGDFSEVKLNDLLINLKEEHYDLTPTGFDEIEIEDKIRINEDNNGINPLGKLKDKYGKDEGKQGSLNKDFIVSPFSILDSTRGEWQEKKKEWLSLIQDIGQERNDVLGDQLGTSILDPVLSEILIRWFTPINGKTFDPFAGDTIFGFVSGYLGYTFTGIELRKEQADFNQKRCNEFKLHSKYICEDAVNIDQHLKPNSHDLLFSCPPYFDLEIYSDLPNDASNQKSYEDFLAILREAFTKAITILKENRFAVVVCGDIRDKKGNYYRFPDDIKTIFEEQGMPLYNEAILINAVGTAMLRARRTFRTRKLVKRHQNVLIFYKGDTSKIKENFPEVPVPTEGEGE